MPGRPPFAGSPVRKDFFILPGHLPGISDKAASRKRCGLSLNFSDCFIGRLLFPSLSVHVRLSSVFAFHTQILSSACLRPVRTFFALTEGRKIKNTNFCNPSPVFGFTGPSAFTKIVAGTRKRLSGVFSRPQDHVPGDIKGDRHEKRRTADHAGNSYFQ